MYLYVLKLECGKYYVGIAVDSFQRISDHIKGRGPKWTRKYKFKECLKVIYLGEISYKKAKRKENLVTKKLMKKFGVENVRGGRWYEMNLGSAYSIKLRKGAWIKKDPFPVKWMEHNLNIRLNAILGNDRLR